MLNFKNNKHSIQSPLLTSSMLFGKVVPFVSGSRSTTKPVKIGTKPKMTVGNHGTVIFKLETKGAIIDPILMDVDDAPIPIFLTTVGNSSDE